MNSQLTKSFFLNDFAVSIDLNRVKELCQKRNIAFSVIGESQLQAAYAMRSFKATDEKTQNVCFIFVSMLKNDEYKVTGSIEGNQLASNFCRSESSMADTIAQCLAMSPVREHLDVNKEYLLIEKLFQDLNAVAEKTIKKTKNEMLAVQEIKSSKAYLDVCNTLRTMAQETQQLCSTVAAHRGKSDSRNEQVLQKLLEVEAVKQDVEDQVGQYESAKNALADISKLLSALIGKARDKVQETDFYDEFSFERYLGHLKDLKTLENQRKYLAK